MKQQKQRISKQKKANEKVDDLMDKLLKEIKDKNG